MLAQRMARRVLFTLSSSLFCFASAGEELRGAPFVLAVRAPFSEDRRRRCDAAAKPDGVVCFCSLRIED